jgi:hypothetical protein
MVRELAVLYETAGRSAFGSAGRLLGAEIDWSLANPRIRQTLNTLAQRIVGINETTRKDVATIVAEGLHEGLTTAEIAEQADRPVRRDVPEPQPDDCQDGEPGPTTSPPPMPTSNQASSRRCSCTTTRTTLIRIQEL